MAFCTHCGAQLIQNAKFCPSCGAIISISKKKNKKDTDKSSAYDEIMHKRVSNSLKDKVKSTFEDKTQGFIKEKAQEIIEENISKPKASPKSSVSKQSTSIDDSNKETSKKVNKWMLYYILFNIPLYFINTGDDEILGVLILSTVVLVGYAIYSFQKKKEKPYNAALKFILLIQGLLAVSYIMQGLEYIGSGSSLVAIISLALLVFLNIRIIFRRNK